MADMMERRKIFSLNALHLAKDSGKILNVTLAEPKIEEFVLYLKPRQAGSGTPSVDNKRALSGWYFPNLSVDGNSITFAASLNGMYNGTYDLKTGYKTTEYTSANLSGNSNATSYSKSGSSSIFWGYFSSIAIYNAVYKPLFSNMFTFVEYSYNYAGVPDWSFCGSSAYPNSAWFKVPTSVLPAASLDGVKQWLNANPIQMVGPRSSGSRTEFVGEALPSFTRGKHHIDASDPMSESYAELHYWAH